MSGYRLALKESVNFIQKNLAVKTDTLGREALMNAAKTSMSSKLLSGESEFFANMVVDAMQNVKMVNADSPGRFAKRHILNSFTWRKTINQD